MTDPVNPRSSSTWSVGELRHGILTLADAFAQSLALLSLALGVATATAAAAISAGAATPWAYIVAGVGCLCLASVIVRFTARIASAGGVYTYIARGLHPNGGFIGGLPYGAALPGGVSFAPSPRPRPTAPPVGQPPRGGPRRGPRFPLLPRRVLPLPFFSLRLSTPPR